MKVKKVLTQWADGNAINSAHVISKISLFLTLTILVLLLDHPKKIVILTVITILLCFTSPQNFFRNPLHIIAIVLTFLGVIFLDLSTGDTFKKIFFIPIFAIRVTLIMVLALLLKDSITDRELRIIATNRLAPILMGALTGLERMTETFYTVKNAQILRGINLSWSFLKMKEWFISRFYSLTIHTMHISENVDYQYQLRNYENFKAVKVMRKDLKAIDIFSLTVIILLTIVAFFPFQ